MFFFGIIFGWFTAGVIYGAALWFYPWRWLGWMLRDAGLTRVRCVAQSGTVVFERDL